jgi:hypothetical protein
MGQHRAGAAVIRHAPQCDARAADARPANADTASTAEVILMSFISHLLGPT